MQVQLIGFNVDLYSNFSMAAQEPNGLVTLAVVMEIGDLSNQALRRVTNKLPDIQYRG